MLLLSPIERYDLGDLDGDGENSFDDFAAFKELYEAANGQGSFAAMLAGVPEPSSTALAIIAGLVLTSGLGKHQPRIARRVEYAGESSKQETNDPNGGLIR